MYEATNQPDADDETRSTREGKRPDFQFGYISHYESDPRKSAKQVAVECKRLGNSGRNDWVLNKNYIFNGVMRFWATGFGYGAPYPFGIMIGYVQQTTLDGILGEVNATAQANSFPALVLSAKGWQNDDVSQLDHSFNRESGSLVLLTHLWLDVRANYK